jgi:hypothetical protein
MQETVDVDRKRKREEMPARFAVCGVGDGIVVVVVLCVCVGVQCLTIGAPADESSAPWNGFQFIRNHASGIVRCVLTPGRQK